jgi:hypothetical protein
VDVDRTYPGTTENRQRIQEVGLDEWLAEQAERVQAGFSYLDIRSVQRNR